MSMISDNHQRFGPARLAVHIGVWILLSAAFGSAAQGRDQQLAPGRILEKVSCINNANQTYALYLPSKYSADRKWPILYAFDAGARGSLPVQLFKAGAEKGKPFSHNTVGFIFI